MPAYEQSVFINCPFDVEFAPLFHAMVLTVVARGFTPRSALETMGEADPRISRIVRGLRQSKYSIHDLSRYQGAGVDNLARFNMPLELGIALGFRQLGDAGELGAGRRHNWLALVPPGMLHQKYISDLAAYDVHDHDETATTVIKRVAAWLSLQEDFTPPTPSAKAILDAYQGFHHLLEDAKDAALGDLTWPAILKAAQTSTAGLVAA